MILRWTEGDLQTEAAFGKPLSWFLDTRSMSARDKNLVMNLVWDVAASEHATRSKLFEESNALNVPFLKERLYGEYDRGQFLEEVRHFIGLGRCAAARAARQGRRRAGVRCADRGAVPLRRRPERPRHVALRTPCPTGRP